jgi:DNA polymerase
MKVHIDVETYCELNLTKVGAYRYCQHASFEILLFAYNCENTEQTVCLDCTDKKQLEQAINIYKSATEIVAHNAVFERLAMLNFFKIESNAKFTCSLTKSAYCGLPLALGQVSSALNLEVQKDKKGAELIRLFCLPKTDKEGNISRNMPANHPDSWEAFKSYCIQDVDTEMELMVVLDSIEIPETETEMYDLDYTINSRGVFTDVIFAQKCIELNLMYRERLINRAVELTGLTNPNSAKQLIDWLRIEEDIETEDIKKDTVTKMLSGELTEISREVLEIRKQVSKTSVSKYTAILNSVSKDRRVKGLFQYYGANRTGRWAGRLVQLQNLPRGVLNAKEIAEIRKDVIDFDAESVLMSYDAIGEKLSSLIRSSFVAPAGKSLCIADLSSIEARILAWLAGETWVLNVFDTHGKIYEATAARMFKVDIGAVDSEMRMKGKVATLALGYQGSVGALTVMGAEKMGLSISEMTATVNLWRATNPNIVRYWGLVQQCVINTIKSGKGCKLGDVTFKLIQIPLGFKFLVIGLPSGRSLYYTNPTVSAGKIHYWGLGDAKKWTKIDSYGGKFTENIVQAVARDVLAEGLKRSKDMDIVIHVHDEIVVESIDSESENTLKKLIKNMSAPITWADNLNLKAEGFVSKHYKK